MRGSYLKEILQLFYLIIITIIAAYLFDGVVSSIIYIVILRFFYTSKNDFVYLALLLTIISQPGFLYYNLTESIIGISLLKISFIELFAMVSYVKYYKRISNYKLMVFKSEYLLYLFGFIFFILYGIQFGMIITGTTSSGLGLIRRLIKVFLLLPLFITIPYMINTKDKLYGFIELVFALGIFNFILQLGVMVLGGTSIHALFNGVTPKLDAESSRPVYGMYIGFLAFIFSIFLSLNKDKNIKTRKKYYNLITGISFFSVVLSATRGWLIAYVIILFFTFLFYFRNSILTTAKWVIPIIIIAFFLSQVRFINNQVSFAVSRFETLGLLYEGDLSAGGTNTRLTDRSDPVIAKFEERPMFGWGISAESADSYDVHVGNQSMLMTSGVVGFSLLIIFLIKFNLRIFKYYRRLKKRSYLAQGLIFFNFVFSGLFIIHSSSTDMFGFMVYTYGGHVSKVVLFAILFGVITMFINFSKEEYNKSIKFSLKKRN